MISLKCFLCETLGHKIDNCFFISSNASDWFKLIDARKERIEACIDNNDKVREAV